MVDKVMAEIHLVLIDHLLDLRSTDDSIRTPIMEDSTNPNRLTFRVDREAEGTQALVVDRTPVFQLIRMFPTDREQVEPVLH